MARSESLEETFRSIAVHIYEIIKDSNKNKKEIIRIGKKVIYIGEDLNIRSPSRSPGVDPIFLSLSIHGEKIVVVFKIKEFLGRREVLGYLGSEKNSGVRIDVRS